jgi:hypothetical protein
MISQSPIKPTPHAAQANRRKQAALLNMTMHPAETRSLISNVAG